MDEAINAKSAACQSRFDPLGPRIGRGLPRVFDIAVALIGLVLTLPLLVASAAIIAITSSGGVLFRQKRVGRGGALFTMYKLRTMKASSEGPQITIRADKRITRMGRFLRITKMDELPTLWNVLKGDMAIVGPRPEVPKYVDWDDESWRLVLEARPGITDPVTLQLRNEEDLLASIDSDPEEFYLRELLPLKLAGYTSYLRGRNWRVDLKVLFSTLTAVAVPIEAPAPKVNASRTRRLPRPFQIFMTKWGRIVLDLFVLVAAFKFSYLLRFEFAIPGIELRNGLIQLLMVVPLQFFMLNRTGVHNFIWRYIALSDLEAFVKAAFLSALPLLLLRLTLPHSLAAGRVPFSIIIMDSILAFGGVLALRISRRLLYERYEKRQIRTEAIGGNKKPVLIIGAGRAGALAAKEIRVRGDLDLDVKGFVDDAREKQGMKIQGIKVVGTTKDLPRIARELGVRQVILTIVEAPDHEVQRITRQCKELGLMVRVVPALSEILEGRSEADRLREHQMRSLIEPEPIRVIKGVTSPELQTGP